MKSAHERFSNLVVTGREHYKQPLPGMLVTSYAGQRYLEATGRLGLGIVVAVLPHPELLGDRRFLCLVLWNFDPSSIAPTVL